MTTKKIQSFTDLVAWQKGHELVIAVYKATRKFPSGEKFGLISQLQRAVVSITSNIAEGFARQGTKEKIQFYYLSLGSVAELQNQLLIARDLEYITKKQFNSFAEQSVQVRKLISGLIRSQKKLLNK